MSLDFWWTAWLWLWLFVVIVVVIVVEWEGLRIVLKSRRPSLHIARSSFTMLRKTNNRVEHPISASLGFSPSFGFFQ